MSSVAPGIAALRVERVTKRFGGLAGAPPDPARAERLEHRHRQRVRLLAGRRGVAPDPQRPTGALIAAVDAG